METQGEEIMEMGLSEIQRLVPYNSFGKILLADKQVYPATMGGNCVCQLRQLIDFVTEGGIDANDISYTTALERPHWVALVNDNGKTVLLDPFILSEHPIDLTAVLRERSAVRVRLYPFIGEESSIAELNAPGPDRLNLVLKAITVGGKHRKVLAYNYDLKNLQTRLPPDNYQLLAGLRQKNLEVGVLTNTGEVVRLYVDPETGGKNIIQVGRARASENKDSERFERILVLMLEVLGLSKEELFDIIERARVLYLRRQASL